MNSLKIYEDQQRNIYAALYCLERSSSNSKTGDMVQLAILPINNKPTKALKTRQLPNCSSCAMITSCYVNTVSLNDVYKKTVNQAVSAVPAQPGAQLSVYHKQYAMQVLQAVQWRR